MRILVIRLARLGDVVLSLPAMARLKAAIPEARITYLTDERFAPLAAVPPMIDEVIPVSRLAWRDGPALRAVREMAALVRALRGQRFDRVIDLQSFRETNLLAWLTGAPQRLAIKRTDGAYLQFCFNLPPVPEDKAIHVSEMFLRIIDSLPEARAANSLPADFRLVPPEAAREWAGQAVVPGRPVMAIFVGAGVGVRHWAPNRFAALADFAVERLGASVLVLAGAGEAALAQQVVDASRHREHLRVPGLVTLPQLTAIIETARLLVSNDTGPMHIGPAVGVPTLGLFSVGIPEHYRPLGARSRYLKAPSMDAIAVEAVIGAVEEMWREAGSASA